MTTKKSTSKTITRK